MRRMMLCTYVAGIAAFSAGLFGFALVLDYPKWPVRQCRAKFERRVAD